MNVTKSQENAGFRFLADLKTGESGIIIKVFGHGALRKRITEMGFVKGKNVTVIKNAPLNDPVEYHIMGYEVSLRRSEARLIQVVSETVSEDTICPVFNGVCQGERFLKNHFAGGKVINIALVGNPNSGKTTLFNHASGAHERVGNYSGVTVEAREAVIHKEGYRFNIVDLPGTYSITQYTPEELYVRSYITGNLPDVVVNVIDASNLERNLYLTTQLIDLNIKVVIALNMYDELVKKKISFNYHHLGKMIGIPVIPTVASRGRGIDNLFKKIIDVFEDNDPDVRHVQINYGTMIEEGLRLIQEELRRNKELTDRFSSRYLALKLIEADNAIRSRLETLPDYKQIKSITDTVIETLEKEYAESSETVITDARYGFIHGALKETVREPKVRARKIHDLDDLLTHRLFGFPLFIFFMWLMFQATFIIGNYPMDLIDAGVSSLGNLISKNMAEGALRDLLIQGIIGGVGGVIIFLPNILILFFFISFMEDSGYMARAAFIMDKLMHRIGLHGKSFIPMIMGFGCNVPAIMATRTLENKSDRLLTILLIPLMSCSARLPVYILLISAFFPDRQGLVLLAIYATGITLAVISALILKKLAFSKKEVPFVMELPPYRIPTLKNTSAHMWFRARQYLKKMGSVILVASIIIWALGYFPRNVTYNRDYDTMIATVRADNTIDEDIRIRQVDELETLKESEHQEKSFIGMIGHAIEPGLAPLGFDWKMGISILTGLVAKEIVVSTMGVLYNAGNNTDENSMTLINNLKNHVRPDGSPVYTPLTAISFMIFILIYFPCIAVIAAIKKEAGTRWAIFTIVYTTALAWTVSFAVYRLGSLII